MDIPEEDKRHIMEEAGKRLVWDMLNASEELNNMGHYARSIIRKQHDYVSFRNLPSKDLSVRYGINLQKGYTNYVWWLLEQLEKGNVTIKEDVQSIK